MTIRNILAVGIILTLLFVSPCCTNNGQIKTQKTYHYTPIVAYWLCWPGAANLKWVGTRPVIYDEVTEKYDFLPNSLLVVRVFMQQNPNGFYFATIRPDTEWLIWNEREWVSNYKIPDVDQLTDSPSNAIQWAFPAKYFRLLTQEESLYIARCDLDLIPVPVFVRSERPPTEHTMPDPVSNPQPLPSGNYLTLN